MLFGALHPAAVRLRLLAHWRNLWLHRVSHGTLRIKGGTSGRRVACRTDWTEAVPMIFHTLPNRSAFDSGRKGFFFCSLTTTSKPNEHILCLRLRHIFSPCHYSKATQSHVVPGLSCFEAACLSCLFYFFSENWNREWLIRLCDPDRRQPLYLLPAQFHLQICNQSIPFDYHRLLSSSNENHISISDKNIVHYFSSWFKIFWCLKWQMLSPIW